MDNGTGVECKYPKRGTNKTLVMLLPVSNKTKKIVLDRDLTEECMFVENHLYFKDF